MRNGELYNGELYNGVNKLTIHKTRFPGLGYTNSNPAAAPCWRFVDLHDAGRVATVGPLFKTKDELLCALEDYAKGWGY